LQFKGVGISASSQPQGVGATIPPGPIAILKSQESEAIKSLKSEGGALSSMVCLPETPVKSEEEQSSTGLSNWFGSLWTMGGDLLRQLCIVHGVGSEGTRASLITKLLDAAILHLGSSKDV
jgi:hypothetical protein